MDLSDRVERLEKIVKALNDCTGKMYTTQESLDSKLFLDKVYKHKTA